MRSDGFIAPVVEMPRTGPEDPRIGHLMQPELTAGSAVALVGFAVDDGVVRNGGRAGAAGGPDAIRRHFYRLTPGGDDAPGLEALLRRTCDLGNLRLTADLEENQERLGELVGELLERRLTVVVLGGGHETTFGHFLGYVAARRPVEILNWDAHADVRELRGGRGHSGSPFRQAIEHPSKLCRRYDVAGLLAHANSAAHLRFVREHGGRAVLRESLRHDEVEALYRGREPSLLVSFDLDVLDQAFAPGVSAPATRGMPPAFWLKAVRGAGSCPAVTSIDFVEVNPVLDRDGQTARLTAVGLWTFLAGRAAQSGREL